MTIRFDLQFKLRCRLLHTSTYATVGHYLLLSSLFISFYAFICSIITLRLVQIDNTTTIRVYFIELFVCYQHESNRNETKKKRSNRYGIFKYSARTNLSLSIFVRKIESDRELLTIMYSMVCTLHFAHFGKQWLVSQSGVQNLKKNALNSHVHASSN